MDLYEISSFLKLACFVLFWFGAIKLNNRKPTTSHKMLVLGFAILTVTNLLFVAQLRGVIVISYLPHYEQQWNTGKAWEPWHKWYYWARLFMQLAGYVIATVGLVLSARGIYQKMKTHSPPML